MNFIATDKQALDIKTNEQVTFIELLREQPPEFDKYKKKLYLMNGNKLILADISTAQLTYDYDGDWNIKLRYPAGKYLVKESWKAVHKYDYPFDTVGYWYKTENTSEGAKRLREAGISFGCEDSKWHSPVSMPAKAVRRELDLTVTVKRVQELTYDEMGFKGMTSDDISDFGKSVTNAFIIKWNKLHAKPRKTKDGKGYECFPYSDEYAKILEQDKRCELIADWYFWKGLPLMYRQNPFVVVMDGKVKKI